MSADTYTASDIKVLEGLEASASAPPCTSAIRRLRPATPGLRGVDNSVDEALGATATPSRSSFTPMAPGSVGDNGRHSRRHAQGDRQVGGGGRAHGPACGRQVRALRVQGVGRVARRGRLRRERAVGVARGEHSARGQGVVAALREGRRSHGTAHARREDDQARHHHPLQAGRPFRETRGSSIRGNRLPSCLRNRGMRSSSRRARQRRHPSVQRRPSRLSIGTRTDAHSPEGEVFEGTKETSKSK